MITYKLKINYQDSKTMASDIELVSGDIGACRLECEFYNNGERADISNYLITVRAKRADGAILSDSGNIVDNKGIINLKNDVYAVPGELYLEIALTDSAKNYITAKVIIANVIEGLGETDETAKNSTSVYVTLLNQLKTQLDDVKVLFAQTKEALGDVGDTETALDSIIAIQNELIGGDGE